MSVPPGPIATPPSTTLSTPSPTELHDTDPLSVDNMPPAPSTRALRHIYLIVATTPVTTPSGVRLGIGLNGSLPWPMIKADMNYFRKVTTDGREQQPTTASKPVEKTINSVFMGRKTYESIPPKFRPLSQRRNHIITRSDILTLAERYRDDLISQRDAKSAPTSTQTGDPKLSTANFEITRTATSPSNDDVIILRTDNDDITPITITSSVTAAIDSAEINPNHEENVESGLLICIGGAEIYNLLLKDSALRPRLRILQTEIQKLKTGEEFECDTFWPEELDGRGSGWREASIGDVRGWTGIEVPQGKEEWKVVEGVGVRLRVRGWVPAT